MGGPDQSLACAYAALILHDDGKSIDAGAIDKMLVAAGCKAGTDACLFEKALSGADTAGLIKAASAVGGSGSSSAGSGGQEGTRARGGRGHGLLPLRLRILKRSTWGRIAGSYMLNNIYLMHRVWV